ncbi:ribonuclease activity regulator RraA [Prosthecomicrobium hirschii]|uniref:RraA family protein n=1 Tax=Prosthecodimorpha hirschii TaxID=665126 RepID=UPI00112C466C|nr:ribonuclease activity regulator RraA [Prosthecomicrobium hirschii]TPQ50038.1 ribonuclease activity regulator RraA [Prosthecomicrobium hirschii]
MSATEDTEALTALCARLARIPTATLSSQLIKRGLRATYIGGARRLVGTDAICGPAFTVRFIPGREDRTVPESYAWPGALPAAMDAAPPGSVVVIDANGHRGAGTFGDIFAGRLKVRQVRGIVCDGAARDLPGLERVGLPVWADGTCAPPSIGGLTFAGWGDPIGCGGAAVYPGDIIVADRDGALVVPVAVAGEIAAPAEEQDRFETWVQARVEEGRPLVGLYPADAGTLAEYRNHQEAR